MSNNISNAQKAISDKMYEYTFHSVEMHPETGVKKCCIDGHNLGMSLGVLPPTCDMLMVNVNPTSMAHIVDSCDAKKLVGVTTLVFSAQPTDDVESKIGVSEHFRTWLKSLPVKIIAFNSNGFDHRSIDRLNTDPALKNKILIVRGSTTEGIRIPTSTNFSRN